jgi:hypothetical protein
MTKNHPRQIILSVYLFCAFLIAHKKTCLEEARQKTRLVETRA